MILTPRKSDKSAVKTNNAFSSTMMASFLPVIVSEKNKEIEENMSFIMFITVSHKWDRIWQNEMEVSF